jgi:hypothetical protein
MGWAVIVLVAVLLIGGLIAAPRLRARKARQLEAADRLRLSRKVANEDVTRFGEELTELHFETLTTELDTPMRQDYQLALDCYESAKQILRDEASTAGVTKTTKSLEEGRFAMACVLARQSDEPLPQRRPPCFFNPAHGPARTDVEWAPPGGVRREIPVCFADAERLKAGIEPDTRMVRLGDRMVPWYRGGPAYAAYVDGYYGVYLRDGLFPTFIGASILMVQLSTWAGWDSGAGHVGGPASGDWGGWDGGGAGGERDYGGGWSGDHGGWGGGGGGDIGGGFEGGGGGDGG